MIDLARNRRIELLAAMPSEPLIALAEKCLDGATSVKAIKTPEVGTVMLTVVEPVERTRFHLAEVLVTRCEVVHRDQRAWAMRMGDDREAVLAAAICDAEVEARGPAAALVEAACSGQVAHAARTRAAEWAELEPTVVNFQEMD